MKKQPTHEAQESQRERFIEAAREAGCSEDEDDFDAAIKKIAKARPTDKKPGKQRDG